MLIWPAEEDFSTRIRPHLPREVRVDRQKVKGSSMNRIYVTALTILIMMRCAFAANTVKTEPPMGALKDGQVVLVDDGSCPAGQIKKVIGGNHVKAGGWKNIERQRSCISR